MAFILIFIVQYKTYSFCDDRVSFWEYFHNGKDYKTIFSIFSDFYHSSPTCFFFYLLCSNDVYEQLYNPVAIWVFFNNK